MIYSIFYSKDGFRKLFTLNLTQEQKDKLFTVFKTSIKKALKDSKVLN